MDKSWFIIAGSNHYGPYSEVDLVQFIQSQKINSQTLILNIKTKSKQTVAQLFLKQKVKVEEKKTFNDIFQILSKTDWPLAMKRMGFIFVPILILFLATFSFNFIQKQRLLVTKPLGVRQVDFDAFKKTLTEPKAQWSVLFSKDYKKMWFGTNIPGTIDLNLEITSIENKVLSTQPIKAAIELEVNDYLSPIDSLSFISGQNFPMGLYRFTIEVKGHQKNILNKIFDSDLDSFSKTSMDLIIGHNSWEILQKNLKIFNQQNASLFFQHQFELNQKYQTITGIGSEIVNFLISLQKNSNPSVQTKQVLDFKKKYESTYGSFFTNFIIENDKKMNFLRQQSFTQKNDLFYHYSKTSGLVKQLGSLSADFFADSKILLKNKKPLSELTSKFNGLIEQSKMGLAKIESMKVGI